MRGHGHWRVRTTACDGAVREKSRMSARSLGSLTKNLQEQQLISVKANSSSNHPSKIILQFLEKIIFFRLYP